MIALDGFWHSDFLSWAGSQNSTNPGNFLELLKFLAHHNEEVSKVSYDNAPGNDKLICNNIQKDIVRSCAFETNNVILKELGDNPFSILLYESRDVSVKEKVSVFFEIS